MTDKTYLEAGVGNEVTHDNMAKASRRDLSCQLGAASTSAITNYVVVPCDSYLVAMYATVSGDPGSGGAAHTVKDAGGSTTYGTATLADGSSAGDTASAELTPIFVKAGTALEVEQGSTTNSVTGAVTVVLSALDA